MGHEGGSQRKENVFEGLKLIVVDSLSLVVKSGACKLSGLRNHKLMRKFWLSSGFWDVFE